MERYEFSDGKSNKFWEVGVSGSTLTVRFGKIGTQGQSKDKDFDSADAALREKAKLIKEKTGKGYVAAGTVKPLVPAAASVKAKPASNESEVPATPSVAEVLAPVPVVAKSSPLERISAGVDDGMRLMTGVPLPTRMRPTGAPAVAPAQAWAGVLQRLRALLLGLIGDAGKPDGSLPVVDQKVLVSHAGVFETMLRTPLAKIQPAQALGWYRSLESVLAPSLGWRTQENPDSLPFVEDFMRALIETHGGEYAVELVASFDYKGSRYSGYTQHAWSIAFLIALRRVFSGMSEDAYQAAVERALAIHAAKTDAVLDTFLAFVLADDRPGQAHALCPRQVLEAAAAQGINPGEHIEYLPLLAEVHEGILPAWRKFRDYFFYFAYSRVTPADVAATICASAAEQGASPVPMLSLIMAYSAEKDRTLLAESLLDTREPAAMTLLRGMTHDKWIRVALDRALEVHPRWMFRELLEAYLPHHPEPAVKVRLLYLCQRHERRLLQTWIADMGERIAGKLATLLDVNAALASASALPAMLQDPPWRRSQRKSVDDLVLDLQMIYTPLELALDETGQKKYLQEARLRWSYRNVSGLGTVAAVRARCVAVEDRLRREKSRGGGQVPPPSAPLPALEAGEDALAAWLEVRLKKVLEHREAWPDYDNPYCSVIGALLFLPETLSLRIWKDAEVLRSCHDKRDGVAMCIRFGEKAVEGYLQYLASAPVDALVDVQHVAFSGFAPYVARAFVQLKKARVDAVAWLLRHPRPALYGLLPDAVGKAGPARVAAEVALRWMQANVESFSEIFAEVVAAYGTQNDSVGEAVQQVLERDPLDQVPARRPKLPAWFVPGCLSRPQLLTGEVLPDDALLAIGEMLSFCSPDAPYAGLNVLRQSCTAESLADFAWDVFSLWLVEGAAAKENWALRTLGWLGGDEAARRLTPLIRKWPGEAAHARAVMGLDVLADIGSDVALMHLNGIAEKLKFKGLQEKAREKIEAIAEARDLSAEELADRLVPDFDLDARGGLDLDFGPRQFRVGFDEFLKPWVKDSNGVRLKDLPKANKADDPDKAGEAAARWSALKKDVRAVASLQLARLETLLKSARRIQPGVFEAFFARHPLVRNLAQRLVWGVYADATTPGVPQQTFRLTEELECADAHDDPVSVDFGEDAKGMIGLVHPLHMTEADRAAWGALFGDYEIAQPFAQLGRDTYALTAEEAASDTLRRFAGARVEAKRLRGMTGRGWRLGEPQDGGCVFWVQRRVTLDDGKQTWALLQFGDGLFSGAADFEDQVQVLDSVTLADSDWVWSNNSGLHTFGKLDAVNASELLRDLSQLVDASTV